MTHPSNPHTRTSVRTQGLVARLEGEGMGAAAGTRGEKEREAELVHLFETLGQGAGEAVRLLSGGGDGVEGPEEVLAIAQVKCVIVLLDALGKWYRRSS